MRKKSLLFVIILVYMGKVTANNPDYLFMIGQAVKAPSGHNTQPWLFEVNENNIRIHPNYARSLPVVDPDNRELFISLGCAAENLCIAASQKGYSSDLSVSGEGIITVHLKRDERVVADPLFDQIAVRQTNRSVYTGQVIGPDTIDLLKAFIEGPVVNTYFYQKGTPEYQTVADYVVKGNVTQMHDKAFTDELKSWMRFNKKHQDRTNDGLSYAVFGAPNLPRFIVKPIISKSINEKYQNKGDRKKIASSSHFVLFSVSVNAPEEWIEVGRVMERFLLKSTELGIVHAYMNQPNEVDSLSVEMAATLKLTGEYPTVLLRIGYGEKMPYSKRINPEEVIL